MEHQSAVAYGDEFKNGYRQAATFRHRPGLKWDFITVHESARGWFANNITAKDNADVWVHESFANYAEGLSPNVVSRKDAGRST
ncbi:MAG: hypothetical protein IPO52_04155 [Gemmatimonadetes bacterium]|nr:hypothetical protein [Gemmatimonadota bacterium]